MSPLSVPFAAGQPFYILRGSVLHNHQMDAEKTSSSCLQSDKVQSRVNQVSEARDKTSISLHSVKDHVTDSAEEIHANTDSNLKLETGYLNYGCPHYRRRCRIRAPCCDEVFGCRHCHNEVKNSMDVDRELRHELPRHEIRKIICSLCNTEQEAQQVCKNCGVCMGKFYCNICKLFDDNISKGQYHCHGCGICRIGGEENFFHCSKCRCCYSIILKDSHPCVEGAMHHNCPVCFEYLFESRNDVSVLPCGHTIHVHCLKEMQQHLKFACPICSKSVCDMSKVWELLDSEIASMQMPDVYQNKKVRILCNDCGARSDVQFHVVAQKCNNCKSYNTRQV